MKPCFHQRNRVSHEILVACARNLPEILTAEDIDKEITRCIKVAPKELLCGMPPEQVEGLFTFHRRLGLLARRVKYIREVFLPRRPYLCKLTDVGIATMAFRPHWLPVA